ncbi:hypothetical protein [Acetobacterium bakii]|uniref:Uncharacterized protein n=1 Tax=Acetobacterium bakii TaxID=52689 RepID=A0A0L6TYS9_9FIRM|nr:hypothetical protein [Acetobacterium bakii]KNZ41416.1 hypothetical protein AKG39_12430 [Acetobacterium bakii]
MNLMMLLIVLAIVVPGYFLVSRLSGKLYSYNDELDKETEDLNGSDGLKEENDGNEIENESDMLNEESSEKNDLEIPDEAIISKIETQTFKKDSET